MIQIPSNIKVVFESYYIDNNHHTLIPLNLVYDAPIVYTMGIFIKYLRELGIYINFNGNQIYTKLDSIFVIPDSAIHTIDYATDNDIENVINYGLSIYSKWVANGKIPF